MAQSSLGSPGLLSAGALGRWRPGISQRIAPSRGTWTWTRSWPRSRVTARSAISPALFGEVHSVLRHPPVRLRRALPPPAGGFHPAPASRTPARRAPRLQAGR